MSLYARFLTHTDRPIHKGAWYFPAYERHFGPFVGRPCTFLEIGAGNGGSSQMWKGYFGPLARIVTVDINPICRSFEDEQVSVRIGDQSDAAFLGSLLTEFGPPDMILDDGSHRMEHVAATFDFLYPRMSPNGVYMVEDMHTAYWPEWGGGYKGAGSFVETFKRHIDDLNAMHSKDEALKPTDFTRSTYAMTAYDSILVFERALFMNRVMMMKGDHALRENY